VELRNVVDLNRYPIDRPTSAAFGDLIDSAQRDLADVGACVLPGFVRPDAIARLVEKVGPKQALAFHRVKQHNVYLDADDPAYAEDHPRNAKETTSSATLGFHHLGDVDEFITMYNSPVFIRFVATALGYDHLYAYEDRVSPVNVLFYPPGTSLGWHFDNATFTTTLMLREAERGAAFEFVPFLRTDTDHGFPGIAALRAGSTEGVRRLVQKPGTLVLFRGSHTIHRVTAVEGATTRLLATMTYAPEPGARLAAVTQRTFYGVEEADDA
jgi:hypothetical protein